MALYLTWHFFLSYVFYFGLQLLKWEPFIEYFLEKWAEEHRHNSWAYRISIKWVFMTLMHCAGKNHAQILYHWVFLQHLCQCHAMDLIWIFLRYCSLPSLWLVKSLFLCSFISFNPHSHVRGKKSNKT